jgi:hypothetical protein
MCIQCKLALGVVFTVLVSALKIIEEIIVDFCHVKHGRKPSNLAS